MGVFVGGGVFVFWEFVVVVVVVGGVVVGFLFG